MLQFQCVKISDNEDGSQALVQFKLLLNDQPTGQQVELKLPPDFCDVGSVFNLTDQDFEVEQSSRTVDSV